jgi:hypothetical protein
MSKKLALLAVTLLILTACGGDDKNETKKVSLDHTFTSATYSVTLNYPTDWTAREGELAIEIGNTQAAIDVMNAGPEAVIPAGSFGLQIVAVPVVETGMAGQPVTDILTATAISIASEDTKTGEVTDQKIGGRDGARVSVINSKQKAEGFTLGFMLNDEILIMVVGMAHEGELSQYEATALKIAESVAAVPAS